MHSLNSFRMAAIYILLKVMLMAGCCNLFQPVWTSAIHVKIFIYIFLCQVMHVYLHHFLHVNLQVPYQYVVVFYPTGQEPYQYISNKSISYWYRISNFHISIVL